MIEAEQLGALCIDLSRLTQKEREELPKLIRPKAVFVVTPPETHCQNAIQWAEESDYIFIEKPFDAKREAIKKLKKKLDGLTTKVYGFDHYAARLKPFLTRKKFKKFKFGNCNQFLFEMFEAAPRGLEERAPSIGDSGMLFDMASHALPVLSWLAKDLRKVVHLSKFYASTLLSPAKKPYIRSETFGRLCFDFTPAPFVGKGTVRAEVRVGKGVGATDSKIVTLTNEKGQELRLDQWFMLARGPNSVEPIHEKVIHRLVELVILDKLDELEESAGVFDIDLGSTIVDVLVSWTEYIKKYIADGNKLQTYYQGWTCEDICQPNACIVDRKK